MGGVGSIAAKPAGTQKGNNLQWEAREKDNGVSFYLADNIANDQFQPEFLSLIIGSQKNRVWHLFNSMGPKISPHSRRLKTKTLRGQNCCSCNFCLSVKLG